MFKKVIENFVCDPEQKFAIQTNFGKFERTSKFAMGQVSAYVY